MTATKLYVPDHCIIGPMKYRRLLIVGSLVLLAGCAAVTDSTRDPGVRRLGAAEGRALVTRLLPDSVKERSGWAADIYAAFASLDLSPSPENICAAIAIMGQESGFQVDPVVPGLGAIARKEIERRRESAGVPRVALDAALSIASTNGKTYGERIDAARTEAQLSEIYEDFIGRVPLGKTFLADRNPVRTAGPMQVSIAYAETFTKTRPYPYPVTAGIRHELFTRRGGLYFGIAHLLSYPAPYPRMLYRFADFNSGQYASRNAAFQSAITQVSGIPLELDGDLLRYDHGSPTRASGSTELAVRVVARRWNLSDFAVREDLESAKSVEFERTRLYTRVFALADEVAPTPAPRAVLPKIPLHSPKITRELTTEWFASRVEVRYQACLKRLSD